MTTPLVIGKVLMAFMSAPTERGQESTISRSANTTGV
jgi:hypothetical protein